MNNDMIEIRDTLLDIAGGIIRFDENLSLDIVETPNTVNLSFKAHAGDTPKLIGGNGKTVDAFRVILRRLFKYRQVKLNVAEPTVGTKLTQDPFKFDPSYALDHDIGLIQDVVQMITGKCPAVEEIKTDAESSTLVVRHSIAPDKELETALSTLWHAIGKANGRKLYVELVKP